MARNTFAAILLAGVLALDATALAQPTNVRRQGPINGPARPSVRSRSTQGWAPRAGRPMLRSDTNRGWGNSGPQFGDRGCAGPRPNGGQRQLLAKRPGQYILPQPYGPDKCSPTFRSCPPRTFVQPGWQRRGWVSSPCFTGRRGNWGYWAPSRPAVAYAPSYYSGYGWINYGDDWATGYEQGRYDADHDYVEYIAAQRAGRLINQWADQFDQAIVMFRDGQYERAALNMLGAAEMNHTDGASRLHAGHALFALGRYEEAIPLIERAFELAPVLTYHSYDIRDEYGDKAQFDAHLQALKDYVAAHPNSAGAVTLLGYVTYYTEGPGAAYPYLKRAAALNPRSLFIPKLLGPASMVRPSTGSVPSPQQPAPPTSGNQPAQDKAKTQTAPWQSNRSGQIMAQAQ